MSGNARSVLTCHVLFVAHLEDEGNASNADTYHERSEQEEAGKSHFIFRGHF